MLPDLRICPGSPKEKQQSHLLLNVIHQARHCLQDWKNLPSSQGGCMNLWARVTQATPPDITGNMSVCLHTGHQCELAGTNEAILHSFPESTGATGQCSSMQSKHASAASQYPHGNSLEQPQILWVLREHACTGSAPGPQWDR